jgi:hypothetical protein
LAISNTATTTINFCRFKESSTTWIASVIRSYNHNTTATTYVFFFASVAAAEHTRR